MDKIKDSIPEIGLFLIVATVCVGFLIGKLEANIFNGIAMAIVGSFYGISQGKKIAEAVTASYKDKIQG